MLEERSAGKEGPNGTSLDRTEKPLTLGSERLRGSWAKRSWSRSSRPKTWRCLKSKSACSCDSSASTTSASKGPPAEAPCSSRIEPALRSRSTWISAMASSQSQLRSWLRFTETALISHNIHRQTSTQAPGTVKMNY